MVGASLTNLERELHMMVALYLKKSLSQFVRRLGMYNLSTLHPDCVPTYIPVFMNVCIGQVYDGVLPERIC